ncbi:hypothetical protein KCU77_g80, partial [Aureobasidium melanogenum]
MLDRRPSALRRGVSNRLVQGGREGDSIGPSPRGAATISIGCVSFDQEFIDQLLMISRRRHQHPRHQPLARYCMQDKIHGNGHSKSGEAKRLRCGTSSTRQRGNKVRARATQEMPLPPAERVTFDFVCVRQMQER